MVRTKMFCTAAIIAVSFFCVIGSGNADAQTRFGIRGGAELDRDDLFLGVHAIQPIDRNWIFNPNFEYTFVDYGTLFSVNADFHYDFPSNSNTIFWIGSGLGIRHFSFEEQNKTDLGLNLLTGVSFSRGPTIPYFQVKVAVIDDPKLLIGGGITF